MTLLSPYKHFNAIFNEFWNIFGNKKKKETINDSSPGIQERNNSDKILR